MLHDLLQLDLGDWHPRRIPKTDGLLSQQVRSLSPEDEWWVGLLEDGTLPASDPKNPSHAVSGDYVTKTETFNGARETKVAGLYECARKSVPRLKGKSDTALGLYLRARGCVNRRVLRHRGWHFPDLAACRVDWERRFPGWVWHDPKLADWGADDA